jgi:putative SOS response-associated peptidase YedK
MCGRFTLRTPTKAIVDAFELAAIADLPLRYNIAPTTQVAVVKLDTDSGQRKLDLMRWGLVPSWADDPKIGYRLINARAESVAVKPSFRSAFQKGRCLIVADGFYEWKKTDAKTKQPFYIRLKDDGPFAFAGLSEHSHRGVQIIDSCCIVTTKPNELMEGIHDRMPVILRPEDYDLWLEPQFHGQGKLLEMLQPYGADEMEAIPIGTYVNNPRNQGAVCIEAAR